LGGLAGVAPRIDRKIAQRHAALHQPARDVEFGGELLRLDLWIDAGNEQFVRKPLLDHFDPARDATGTACRHDNRIGLLARDRLRQSQRESEKAERVYQEGGSEEAQDQSIFRSEDRTVMRAV
jgi:hypothetical protein